MDLHLETVTGVTLSGRKYTVLRAVGNHLLIAVPEKAAISARYNKVPFRVQGLPPSFDAYMIPATGIVLHREKRT